MFPKLRFQEFDGAWSNSKIDDIAVVTSGGTPSRSNLTFWDGNIPWVTTSLVDFNIIQSAEEFITQKGLDNSSAKLFPKNTILMAMYGQGITRGKVAILGIDATTNQACAAIKLQSNYDTQFIFQNLMSRYEEIRDLSNDGGQKNLSAGIIKEIEVYYPEKTEQIKIASFLSVVDEKISQFNQKHELLSQYKQGMMQKLFSQQIRFKADDGSEFREWERAKVGNITETIFGYPFDSKDMVEDNSGIPLMRGINIGERHIRHSLELDRFFLKDISKLEKYFVQVNDIVLSMDGSKVGRNSAFVTIKDTGSLLVQRVCILREKENTNIQYVYQWIISKEFHRYVDQVKTSSGIPHISGKQIQDYEISYPCLEEQTKIANFLSVIDQKIEMVTQQIEQAKTWKKGLLQQMFV